MNTKEVGHLIEKAIKEESRSLDLSNQQIEAIPALIGRAGGLVGLYLRGNVGLTVPDEIGDLPKLEWLDLSCIGLSEVPAFVARLKGLKFLDLSGNRLRTLPVEIMDIPTIDISHNPFDLLPPELVRQGTDAILEDFRERRRSGEKEQWVSKLVVVGQGGVGKTCLLRALRGEKFVELETTHGVEIGALELGHPDPNRHGVVMRLNTWDFAGQEINHATHQFFLTNRSLFLLAWNARQEWEQGKLYYWLDTIEALAPDSPILLVATQIDERDARLPIAEIRGKYPNVAGNWPVSNITGAGIDELRTAIANTASRLPLMGVKWASTSLAAANAIRELPEKHTSPQNLMELMATHGVPENLRCDLAQRMHDLGDILYFQHEEESSAKRHKADLDDIVILKPEWVTRDISKVLESEEVEHKKGIFSRKHMNALWPDLAYEPHIQDVFLRLMERFDLSYRTLESPDLSLVVERLPLDAPNYAPLWNAHTDAGRQEIAIRYQLSTIPAGIPTWFFAREHKYTTETHWRNGAVFAQNLTREMRIALSDAASASYALALAAAANTHLALVTADARNNSVKIVARGPMPANFFALMRDGMEYVLARFPGLEVKRFVPCPGHNGEPCDFEFDLVNLETAVQKGRDHVQCGRTYEDVSVMELLYGVHPQTTIDAKLDEILEVTKTTRDGVSRTEFKLDALTLKQREFTAQFISIQESIDRRCPNVFTLVRNKRPGFLGSLRDRVAGGELVLHLCCQQPGAWHPVLKGGVYTIHDPATWLKTMGPYMRGLISVLKFAAPLVGPIAGIMDDKAVKEFENQIKLMEKLVEDLPEIEEDADLETVEAIGKSASPVEAQGRRLRALRYLLGSRDKSDDWGGLDTCRTKEGHLLWLCEHHKALYRED